MTSPEEGVSGNATQVFEISRRRQCRSHADAGCCFHFADLLHRHSTFLQEDAIGLEPPPPSCADCPKPVTPAIIIFVDANNYIRIGSALTDISSVRSGIERRRAESPDAAVIIQADTAAHTGTLIRLRDVVYDAKVDRVNIVRSSAT